MRVSFIVALLLFGTVRGLAAQELFEAADRETAAQLMRIVQNAESRALPTDPIVAKARYGIVMKSPPGNIVTAARAVASRLQLAKDALAPSPTSTDIAAGADALGAGVTVEALKRIRAESPRAPVAVPVGVLAQLVANRVSLARATNIVIDLMRRGATEPQLIALGGDVNSDVALGGNPDNALDVRVRGLIPQIGPPGSFGLPGGDKVTVPTATTASPPPPTQTGKPPVKKP